MLFHAALGVVTFVVAVLADDKKDLGTVLSGNKNLTKFYELIKVCLSLPFEDAATNSCRNILMSCWSCRVTTA